MLTVMPPDVTLTPFLAVIIPTESMFVTSVYVSVPPTDTLPENVPVVPDIVDAVTEPTVILGVPDRPAAVPEVLIDSVPAPLIVFPLGRVAP